MLNYIESAHLSTIVPFFSVPCIETDAQCTTTPEPLAISDPQADALLTPETFTFRKAVIETESTDELRKGIICGQDCAVDLGYEYASLPSKDLAHLFAETMNSDEPEAFNVGFIVGVVDALLRARKTYPRGWTPSVSPEKEEVHA